MGNENYDALWMAIAEFAKAEKKRSREIDRIEDDIATAADDVLGHLAEGTL